jgi:hypothetical protein
MSLSRPAVTRFCFAALLVLGVGLLLVGLLVVPYEPYFQLDVVLNRLELADEDKKRATLELLKRASGNRWIIWSVFGISVSGLSAVGLWASRTVCRQPVAQPPCERER